MKKMYGIISVYFDINRNLKNKTIHKSRVLLKLAYTPGCVNQDVAWSNAPKRLMPFSFNLATLQYVTKSCMVLNIDF